MQRARPLSLLVALALVAGCGSSSKSSSSTAAAPASSAPLTLSGRVLRTGDLPGFTPAATPSPIRNVNEWLAAQGGGTTAADAARLRRLHFVAGLREDLVGSGQGMPAGLSLVEQFSSSAAAASELTAVANMPVPGQKPFAVSGIPGAHGFGGSAEGQGGYNVAWADGPYFYLVGAGYGPGTANPPTTAQVIAAAHALYRRVHGH